EHSRRSKPYAANGGVCERQHCALMYGLRGPVRTIRSASSGRASEAWPKSELVRVVLLHLLDALVRAQERVLAHVRRIPARGWMPAGGFRQGADMVRPGAAAHAQIANVQRQRGAAELGDLEAVANEGIQRGRERAASPIAVPTRVTQRLERRLLPGRTVRNRQRSDVWLHGIANLLEKRKHRVWTADAVQADHICAGVGKTLAGLGSAPPLACDKLLVHGQRDHGRLSRRLDRLERDLRFLRPGKSLADDIVDAGVGSP